MLRGDRDDQPKTGLVFTVLIAGLAVFAYWAMFYSMGRSSGLNEQRANMERQHYAAETPKRVQQECPQSPAAALQKCVTDIVNTERESQRAESDLAAQWQAADWVLWAAIIAGAQGLITLIGTALLYDQVRLTRKAVKDTGDATKAMEQQNDIASATAKHQLRAYVCAVGIEWHPIIIAGVKRLRLQIVWKNSGATPAINVGVFGFVFFSNAGEAELEQIKVDAIGPKVMTIAPGTEIFGQESLIDYDKIEDVFEGKLKCSFVGSAHYRDVFGRNCETRAQFNLRFIRDPDEPLTGDNVTEIVWLIAGPHNGIYDD